MKSSTISNIVAWVVTVLLVIAFLGAGLSKLSSQPMMIKEFGVFGYPLWFMYFTGALEVVCAIGLLVPRAAFYAVVLLLCTMIGAIISHVTHGQAAMIGAPVVLLVLLGVLAYLRKPAALATA